MPSPDLGRLKVTRKSGAEPFHDGKTKLGFDLLDFWRWSVSDLVSNATRGRLAEYIVARALGIDTSGVRDEWARFDLLTPEGVKVEVKSSGYVQTWIRPVMRRLTHAVQPGRRPGECDELRGVLT